ncbi:glycoside hydrolase family 5 protein [Methylobacterium phyllosphaerae]
MGVNLSGPEWKGSAAYPAPGLIDYYIKTGMTVFRLPFLWERLQPKLGADLSVNEVAALDRVVDQVTRRGIYIVLDMHNYMRRDGEVIGENTSKTSAKDFGDFWGILSRKYKDNNLVIFGLMNEPYGIESNLNVANQNEAITRIRDTGARNLVLASPNYWSGAWSWNWSDNGTKMLGISDPIRNTAYDMHQYLDKDGGGSGVICAKSSGSTRLAAATVWLREHGKRAFLGEFGTADNDECLSELRDLLKFLSVNKDVWLGWTYWAGGGHWPPGDPYQIDPIDLDARKERKQMKILKEFSSP